MGKLSSYSAATSVGSSDIIPIVQSGVNKTATRSLLVRSPEFDVRDYGALFDGTTDDLAAVQAAVNAANTAGGGTVVMPSGTGRFQGALTLYPGVRLKGQGMGATTWQTLDTTGALTGSYAIKLNGGADDYITVEGFELVGHGEGQSSGYGIYDSSGVNSFLLLKDLYIRQFPQDGIYLNDPILSSVQGCWLRDNGRDGLFIEVGTTCYVSYVYASGNNRAGIHMKTHTSSVLDNCASEYNTANFWLESCGNITLNSPYVELTMRGDSGTLGYAAAYRIQSSQNIVVNAGYSNSFAYLSGVSAYHLYITGSSRVILNAFRGKALAAAEEGEGEAPTYTVSVDSSSTVHANNINFTDLTGGGQTGTFASEIKGDGRIPPRVGTTTSSATPTINTDNVDYYSLTAQAADITSFTSNLSGTPTSGQKLWISITGTGARAITWGASFEASTVALPTTTVSTNRLDVGFTWNSVTSKWRCVATA